MRRAMREATAVSMKSPCASSGKCRLGQDQVFSPGASGSQDLCLSFRKNVQALLSCRSEGTEG